MFIYAANLDAQTNYISSPGVQTYASGLSTANKIAYTAPSVAQYASTYTPAVPIVAKQVSYAANPLLTAGIVKTAGYHAGGIGYVSNSNGIL